MFINQEIVCVLFLVLCVLLLSIVICTHLIKLFQQDFKRENTVYTQGKY